MSVPTPNSSSTPLHIAWQLFKVSFVACLPFALVAICAGGLPQAYARSTGHSLNLGWWLVYAVSALLALLCYGAVILRQHALLTGAAMTAGACLVRSLRQLPTALLVVLVAMPALLLGPLAICLLLAWPSLLVEDTGPVAALENNLRRLRGRFWQVLGTVTVGAAGLLVYVILARIFAAVIMLIARPDSASAAALGAIVVSLLLLPPVLYFCAMLVAVQAGLLTAQHQQR
jgi:hypothetical protein